MAATRKRVGTLRHRSRSIPSGRECGKWPVEPAVLFVVKFVIATTEEPD